eukprot:CAMPEP_0178550348 /NCGR_PEP_ID=MMETSP0697-20121206/6208_1 /TAXON_ID=265572 /ORGANISM="Extubocellulus spinifer, Strain CCMP396" /LENGTH=64 /DNA_ID=CAMNT_0020183137 /DNA_START=659 /DNA_END=849 /DNA_ORIENTATION=-
MTRNGQDAAAEAAESTKALMPPQRNGKQLADMFSSANMPAEHCFTEQYHYYDILALRAGRVGLL